MLRFLIHFQSRHSHCSFTENELEITKIYRLLIFNQIIVWNEWLCWAAWILMKLYFIKLESVKLCCINGLWANWVMRALVDISARRCYHKCAGNRMVRTPRREQSQVKERRELLSFYMQWTPRGLLRISEAVYMHAQSLRLIWLCNLMDCGPPDSSIHGILQARILKGVAISSSKGSSRPGDWPASPVSLALAGGFLTTEQPGNPLHWRKGFFFLPSSMIWQVF